MNEKAMPFPTPTDTLTSPEPASAEVGAQFKPTDLEAGWAEAAIKMQDQGVPRAVASAIHGAVEEALAAVEAELIQIYEERDSVIKNSLEVTAGLEKAKEDSELLDWVEQTKGQMIIDTDTLIPPKWFITDPHNKVLAHRCDTVRQAIRSAIVASKENK